MTAANPIPADNLPSPTSMGPALFIAIRAEDIEYGCGGARQLHLARGDAVNTLILGPHDESVGGLDYSEANISRVVDAIAHSNATVVYAPWPGEQDVHCRTLALVVREAVRRQTKPCTLAQYELQTPLQAPNQLMDISGVLDAKLDRCALTERAKAQALNGFRGASMAPAVAAAEAFACFSNTELARAPDVAQGMPRVELAQRPLVSVLLRSSARSTLAQALESVESQTYPNIEIIVVNVTGAVHAPLASQRFAITLLEPGRALSRSEAMAPLLGAARGDWLLFLDDDDWLLSHHIDRLQQALAHKPGSLVAYSGVGCVDASGAPLTKPVYDMPYDRQQLLGGNYIPIHAVLFSRQLLALGCSADTALAMYEDWDFWLQLSSHTPFLHVPGVSAIYRQNADDQSGAQRAENTLAARQQVLAKWLPREPVAMPAAIASAMVRDARALAEYSTQSGVAQLGMEALQRQMGERDQLLQQSRDSMAELRAEKAALEHQLEGHRVHENWLNNALQQSQSETSQRQSEIAQVLQSSSWRLTWPLRAVVLRVRSVREAWRRPSTGGAGSSTSWRWRARQKLVRVLRTVYVAMPLPLRVKVWLRDRIVGLWVRFNSRRQRTQSSVGALDGSTSHNFVRKLYSTGRLQWERADYVPYTDQALTPEDLSLRCIAYYLPQFHPIPENDRWWGKGFTEWTNVTRALPQFVGHYQPKLPGDLGFYDLRVVDTMRKQAELARHYGLAGFCMYYYWFGGHRLLDMPQRQILDNPDLEFPFCLCWANENWTRRWDGQEADVLMAQKYSPEDDVAMIDDLSPSFADRRYIRIGGKPVFLVYQPTHLPTLRDTVQRWRQRCRENGVGELYLVAVESFKLIDPHEFGFDATCEFPPHQASLPPVNDQVEFINDRFEGRIYDYAHMAEFFTGRPEPKHVRMSGITTAWDNEARKPGKGNIFINTSPENYAKWLEVAASRTNTSNKGEERVLFVNAWNEWAEGTYLEPDRRFGYAYLHATANVLRQFRTKDLTTESMLEASRTTFTKKSSSALVVHLFYRDLLDELCLLVVNAPGTVDLFITVADDAPQEWVTELRARLPNAYLMAVPNRGRDILPFYLMLPLIQQFGYVSACKLHSKKSPHRDDGKNWRNTLWHGLYGRNAIGVASKAFESDKSLGLLAPSNSLTDLSPSDTHINNRPWLDRILQHVEPKRAVGDYRIRFPAGSMFWFHPAAMPLLADLGLSESDFEVELGQVDGTLAHALERMFAFGVKSRGYKVDDIAFRRA